MRTTARSPAYAPTNVSPLKPPSSGVSPTFPPGASSKAETVHAAHRPRPHYCSEHGRGAGHRWTERDQGQVGEETSRQANRRDWDRYADEYQSTHGAFLGDAGFVWGPEGHTEDDTGLLGDVTGKRVLELGCGAGQCSRWVIEHGGTAVGLDLSLRQLQHSRRIDAERGTTVPAVCATATQLPLADDSFDVVFSSFGALQFVADAGAAVARWPGCCARVDASRSRSRTRPGGCSPTTRVRVAWWPRSPTGTARRTSRSTTRAAPSATSSTTGPSATGSGCWPAPAWSWCASTSPEWPEHHDRTWGGWSRTRGRLTPGTAIFVAELR